MHEDLQIPNFGDPGKGPSWRWEWSSRSEPMVNAYGPRSGWIRRLGGLLAGRLLAAHFEFTVAVARDGPRISPLAPRTERGLPGEDSV